MPEQLLVVQREIGWGDHGDRVGGRLERVRGQRHGVPRRLRPGVDRDLEPVGATGEEQVGHSPPFRDREQHPLAGRPTREHAVDAALREEDGQSIDSLLVQVQTAVRQRRDGGGDRSAQRHGGEPTRWVVAAARTCGRGGTGGCLP